MPKDVSIWPLSISTVTRMFHKCIDVMNERMKFLINILPIDMQCLEIVG